MSEANKQYQVNSNDLITVADAIRLRTGETRDLIFPDEFVVGINSIAGTWRPIHVNGTEILSTDPASGFLNLKIASGSVNILGITATSATGGQNAEFGIRINPTYFSSDAQNGLSLANSWISTLVTNPMQAANDLIIGGTSGAPTRLAGGSIGQVLGIDSNGNIGWLSEAHTGTVTSVTLTQGTGITVSDSGVAITSSGTREISLNIASTSALGGIRVGEGLTATAAGVLSIDSTTATEGDVFIRDTDGFAWTHQYTAYNTSSIPWGKVNTTSTSTLFTATVPGVSAYRDGVSFWLKNGVVTSASGFTININGLGAKKVYSNMAPTTRDTTIFNINYTMLFVYDAALDDGAGAFVCYRGYDANTNTIGYQVRTNNSSVVAQSKFYRYRLLFTSPDGTEWVPANTSTSTNATAVRTTNQAPIDPFGPIVWYGTTTAVDAGAAPGATYLWQQYYSTSLAIGYSFNRTGAAATMTAHLPVYLKCAPQADGSAIIDAETPYVQALPATADGKIYILLGRAVTTTCFELLLDHPVYAYINGHVQAWAPYAATAGSAATAQVVAGGTNGQVLISNGTRGIWTAAPWMTNPMTAANDLMIGGTSGAVTRLAKGANGQVLGINSSGNIAWVDETHVGTVTSVTLTSGTGITVSDSGVAITTSGDRTISLNIASPTALGGVKVGEGLSITAAGVLAIDSTGADEGDYLVRGTDGFEWRTPTDANYYHVTGTWNGLTYTADKVGSPGDLAFTIPTGTSATTVARGDHTHTNMVTGSGLTANYFVIGNGGSAIAISTMRPSTSATSWSTSSDVYVPTMKAISSYIAGLGYTTNTGTVTSVTLTSGTGITVSNSGEAITTDGTRTISLNIASTTALGGVKVGEGLSINSGNGILSIDFTGADEGDYLRRGPDGFEWAVPANTTYTLGVSGDTVTLTPNSGAVQSITVPYATAAASATNASHILGGANGQVLISNGTQGVWSAAPWMLNPMTAANDLIVGGTSGAATRLAKGSNGQILGINANGNVAWINEPHTGTVTSVTLTAGTGITVSDSGTAITTSGTRTISLNTASTSALGGVRVGEGLSITAAGVLSIDSTGADEGDYLRRGPDGFEWGVPANTTYTLGTSGNTITLTPNSGSVQSITAPYATSAGSATNASNLLGGTNGQVLISNGTKGVWSAAPWMTNPMTAANDLIIGGTSGAATRLAKGSNGQILGINSSGNIAWISEAHVGTVTSVTITQGTGITVSDSGTAITTSGTRTISLNTASTTALGGVKVGEGLNITAAGVLAIDSTGADEGDYLVRGTDGFEWRTPTDANYYHTTGTWNGLTYTAAKVGSPGDLAFTIPTGTSSTTVAVGNHTHAWNSLTRTSATAGQVIVSTATANGWELKTLGTAAYANLGTGANDAAYGNHSHTNMVTGSGLTSGQFVLGNNNSAVTISTMKPTTSSTTWSATSDVNVPTMKAISAYVTGLGYTTNTGTVTSVTITQGTGITVSDSGTAITTSGSRTISLNIASTTALGGVKVGEGLSITAAGVLAIDSTDANEGEYLQRGPDGFEWHTPANYYHTTGSWSGLTYTATANGGAGALAFTIPTGTTADTVAVGNHTHTNMVTGSGLTANYFAVGNGNSAIKISSMQPVTSSTTWSTSSDVYVPTMKAISSYVTGLGYTTNTGTVIGSGLTAEYFVVGNGTVNVKISSMRPSTSATTWSTSSDVYVPTMKAISSYVTGLGYTTNTGTVTSVTLTQGTGITVSDSGTAITTSGTRTISLNIASATALGGVKVGEGLSINTANGILSIDATGADEGDYLVRGTDGFEWRTPTDANYYHTTGTWNGLTYTAAKVGSPGDLAFTIPTGTSSTTVAVGNHTHAWNTLTRPSTTAGQVIVSTASANGWELKTLGTAAYANLGTGASDAAYGNHTHTNMVTGSGLTSGYFVVGNTNSAVTISTMKPTTSGTTWSTSSDVNVPTMKAISSYVTGLGYTSNTGTVTSVTITQGTGITVSNSGTEITTTGTRTISLNTASATALGGVKVGEGLSITAAGVLAIDATGADEGEYLRRGTDGFEWATPTDTNNAVTQTATTTNATYEVLFSNTADNTTRTEGARKNSNLLFNPSTGTMSTVIYTMLVGTTAKARMNYDNTVEAIKFTFV